jgi:diketogulonate reductase-like aldo/keto reductase
MRFTPLPSGEQLPVLGLGTWHMGERPQHRQDEIDTIRFAIDNGMKLVDTAEMYGDGAAEQLIGQALSGRRTDAFIVSKVLPHHATRRGTVAACEDSLRRLGTGYLDMYLLHWRGPVPLDETLEAFDALLRAGKIRYWGVSNFDTPDMEEVLALPGGNAVAANQVLYNPTRRGIEFDLVPWCRQRQLPIMAYSPLEQGRLLRHPALLRLAAEHGATPVQIALRWVLRDDPTIALPKAGTPAHARELLGALDMPLSPQDMAALDRAFPPPERKLPLEVI